jgi:hypothetical protein
VEARLTDILIDPRGQIAPGAFSTLPGSTLPGDTLTSVPKAADDSAQRPQSAVTLRIDRYLVAAGAGDRAWRGQITAAVARDLLAHGASGEPGWAEIIAAVDRCLAAEFAAPHSTPQRASARGRVALYLTGQESANDAAAQMGRDWGAPTRQPQPMAPQDLTRWSPTWRGMADGSAGWLQRLRVSRSAQGVAACLCCLAVIIIP